MSSPQDREARLESAVAEYLQAMDAGEKVDREAILGRHPELRDELLSFFRNHDGFDRLAEPIREAARGPNAVTLGGDDDGVSADGKPLLRYFGDYEILTELARGGMGIVYRAQQVSLVRVVALKMILAGELASPDALLRFRQEAQEAANLDHPNIVPIYEIGEHQGQHYFTMKLIEGGSLATRIGSAGKPATPQREAVSLIATVARAVHHAHQRGVLHRDLKPGNILLDTEGRPHVSDFGLAKRIDSPPGAPSSLREAQHLTVMGAVVGTPAYMSPEQARATGELTTAADVYSLGALLYAMLTGRPPHEGKSASETLMLALAGDPARPSRVNPQVGRDLETICLKCLERDPDRRYDSASALADDLERWLRGEPVLARPASTWERSAKWARRRPAVAALLLVSVVALVGLIALLSSSNRRISNEETRTRVALNAALEARAAADHSRIEAEQARMEAVGRLYPTQILLAHSAIGALQLGQAARALDATDPIVRGWEWRYLNAAANRQVPSLTVEQPPNRLRFSSDGSTILYASTYGRIERIGVSDSEVRSRDWDNDWTVFPNDPTSNLTVTADQKLAAMQNRNGLWLWTLDGDGWEQLMPISKIQGELPINMALIFSPDASLLFAAGNHALACWDVRLRKQQWSVPVAEGSCWAIDVSHDLKRLAVGMEDRAAHVFDLETRKEIFHGAAFSNKPNDLKFVDDAGTRLIACAGWANPQLWDIPSNRQLLRLTGSWWTTTALSPDHRLAATGGGDGGDVLIWDASTGKTLHVLHADPAFINVIRFSPDGSLLACGGRNRTVRLWDVATGKLVKELVGHTDDIVGLDFSPDGKRLASGSQAASDGIKLWDVAAPPTPYRLIGEAGWYRSWSLSPDGRILVAAGAIADAGAGGFAGITELFDLQAGTRLRQFKTNAMFGIQAIALDAAGVSLAAACHDGSVRLYEIATGREIRTLRSADPTPRGDNNAMASAAFAPDGKSVSVATNDGWIFDLATDTGKELWRVRRLVSRDGSDRELTGDPSSAAADKMRIVDMQYIHGGDWLLTNGQIGMYRGAVAIYDARNGERLFLSPKSDGAISISPDQRTMACGAGSSDAVILIDTSGLAPVLETSIALTNPAQIHQNVGAVAFSPDGKALAVARGADIGLYDVASRALRSSLHGHESTVSALAWLPDGSRLISGGWDHTVIVWDPLRAQALLNLPLGDTLADRVEHLLIAPDGSRIIGTNGFPYAGSGGKTLMVWTAPKP